MVEVKCEGKVPEKAHSDDACFDLTAEYMNIREPAEPIGKVEYGLNFKTAIPAGYCALVFPRSSVHKKGMWLCNSVGVIDSGYRGEWKAMFYFTDARNLYEPGERIVQVMIVPLTQTRFVAGQIDLDSERGEGGFGSSGD